MTSAASTVSRAEASRVQAPTWRGLLAAAVMVGRGMLLLSAAVGLMAIRNPTSIGTYALGFGLCAAAAVGTLGLRRDAALMVGYVTAFAVFAYIRAAADETGIPVQFEYAINLERMLPGPLPNVWLQEKLWSPGVSALDVAATVIHLSYFVFPHAAALALWRWQTPLTARYVVAILLTFYAALLFSVLVPTAPPWLAAEEGLIPDVVKVNDWVFGDAGVDGYSTEIVRMNPVAAMPSLHFAITVVAAVGLAAFGRWGAIGGTIYALLMAFALVYMGEHWVVDLVAGGMLAAFAWVAAPWLVRLWEGRRRSTVRSVAGEAT